ncbi:porin [Trinickia sp. YCB016]
MNKTTIQTSPLSRALHAVVLPMLAAAADTVPAQGSTTLYGIVDNGLVYTHRHEGNGPHFALVSGSLSGSRWGIKGSEPLGNGMSAAFQLENGLNLNTGRMNQGQRLFGRQSYFGLKTASGHAVFAGRMYDPLTDLVQPLQGDGYLGQTFSSPGDVDNADSSARVNHAVKWTSPSWNGLRAEALYGFGGVAGSPGSGQSYSAAASYARGRFALAGGYLHIDRGNAAASKRGVSSADSLFNSAVNAAYVSAKSIDIVRVASSYAFSAITIGGYYSDSRYAADAASHFTRTQVYRNASVYGVWQATAAVLAELGYDFLRASGDSSARYHQISLAGTYALSKRSDLYGVLGYTHASGSNGHGAAQGVIGATGVDAGGPSQARANLGVRHRF